MCRCRVDSVVEINVTPCRYADVSRLEFGFAFWAVRKTASGVLES
jgi:hypothetical protein